VTAARGADVITDAARAGHRQAGGRGVALAHYA